MDWIGLLDWTSTKGEEGLPTFDFHLLTSDFRFPIFRFFIQISDFRFFFLIPTSIFQLLISNSERLKYFNFISCGSLRALLTQERFNLTSNWLHLFNIHWRSHYPADNAIGLQYYLSAGQRFYPVVDSAIQLLNNRALIFSY